MAIRRLRPDLTDIGRSEVKTAFLYAGQGSQRVGMGKDFYDEYPEYAEFIDSLKLDFDLKKYMHEGPIEELSKTCYTQACMSAFAAGVTMLLKSRGITPDASCGLSLGEYGALYAAGVFEAEQLVRITAFRGKVMTEAAQGCECSMSAILGSEPSVIEQACSEYDGPELISVANYNCPGQTVICGDEKAVAAVESELKEKGAKRCVRLNVSGPFHTKYMEPAGKQLERYFKDIEFKTPDIPVALNVTGDFYDNITDLAEILVKQVQSPVRLESELRTLLESGYSRFIEIGPGNTMSGFLKKTAKAMGVEAEVVSIDNVEDFRKVAGE